ncbi:ABC transporter substrate-binding protein [Sinomicrobium weinanense]|uniref:ABC transporter substrate-binding protein n=1 Tax=Sinomicrobium weinanense TaxID=2842200 RepID=A0A926Q2J0_9FLAO|nr:ABC transporter substrate-binding protein [Sinomicrobium weinanense]MBC9796702.1 ABC transporter substrate-binding protein [Sinomicrobium weinanense]MBU3123023.1 ABC transporter substrate-binding protein [Sinomicrobium weinanense]
MIRAALVTVISLLFLSACKREKTQNPAGERTEIAVKYAKGFRITRFDSYTKIEVSAPWPDAKEHFTYILTSKGETIPDGVTYDTWVNVPVENVVVTSTTHIPALEALGVEDRLTGFPDTRYISSEKTRKNVDLGRVKELGNNESINTEVLIDLQPDVVVGFALSGSNKTYETVQRSGIPVVFNGDWVEESPLGKAEWIKFFAPFFGREAKADSIFNHIETEYLNARKLTENITEKPTVLSGAMHKDVWILPGGKSWAAQFIRDAGGDYLWKDTDNTGSLFLSFESVLNRGQDSDFWISPTMFSGYEELKTANPHYKEFKPFRAQNIYTYSKTKGAGGGMLYYELGPNRPDIILKDLIHIFHPEILPEHQPFFFKPLDQ